MITFALLTFLYFLPTVIRSSRGHGAGGILILNVLFGWTGIGWFVLLLWALTSPRPYYYAPVFHPHYGWRRY